MSCNIDFTGGNFTFNYPRYGEGSITIPTARIYGDFKPRIASIVQPNTKLFQLSALGFREANEEINYGDCNKDNTPLSDLNDLNVFPNITIRFSGDEVKAISKLIAEEYEKQGLIIRQLFSRDKKGDSSVTDRWQGLKFRCTFDSGLGLQNFLQPNSFRKVESFGKYIDPSSSRESDEYFPQLRVPLTISKAAFQELGYTDCLLTSATAIGRDTYAYDLNLGGLPLNHNGSGNDKYKDPNGTDGIFVGNAKKKGISARERARKIAAILGKSLGDKLMTFLTYVDYILNVGTDNVRTDIICISTCDEIVLLLCMILGLPCLFSNIDTGDKLRLNKVLYYNPDNVSEEKATIRFNKEKEIILKGYADLIAIVTEIRDGDRGTGLYISITQHDKKFKIASEFYTKIIEDLQFFEGEINGINVDGADRIDTINMKVAYVQRYKVNNIFKINKPGSDIKYSLISTTSKYSLFASAYDKMKISAQASIQLPAKTVSLSFSFIAKTYFKDHELTFGGSKKMKGGVPPEVDFDQTPMVFYYKHDDDEERFPTNVVREVFPGTSKETGNYIVENVYEVLNSDIHEIYTQYVQQYGQTIPFVDIYSETLTALCSDGNGAYQRADYNPDNIHFIINYLFSEKIAVRQEEILIMAEIEAVRNEQQQLQQQQLQQQQLQQVQQIAKPGVFSFFERTSPPEQLTPRAMAEIEAVRNEQQQLQQQQLQQQIAEPGVFSFIKRTSPPEQLTPRAQNKKRNGEQMEDYDNKNAFLFQPNNNEPRKKFRANNSRRLNYDFGQENIDPNQPMEVAGYGGKKNKKTLSKQTKTYNKQTKKYNKQTKKKRNYPKNARKNSKTIKQKNNKTQKNKTKK
jgi:hypothetical protein